MSKNKTKRTWRGCKINVHTIIQFNPHNKKKQMNALVNNLQNDKEYQMPSDQELQQMVHQSMIRNDGKQGGITIIGIKSIPVQILEKLNTATHISFAVKGKVYGHAFQDDLNLKEKIDQVFALCVGYGELGRWRACLGLYYFLFQKRHKYIKKCNWCKKYFPKKAKHACKCGKKYYCNYKCQKLHWKNKHRMNCVANKKVIHSLSMIINKVCDLSLNTNDKCIIKICVFINKLCDFTKNVQI